MIKSVANKATRQFIDGGKSKFPGLDATLADRRLAQLSAATSLQSFRNLNAVGLHKLKGPLRRFWSIDVNGPWRIIFKFEDGDAYEVQITDTH